jgi:hypothetical protein
MHFDSLTYAIFLQSTGHHPAILRKAQGWKAKKSLKAKNLPYATGN